MELNVGELFIIRYQYFFVEGIRKLFFDNAEVTVLSSNTKVICELIIASIKAKDSFILKKRISFTYYIKLKTTYRLMACKVL